MKSGGLRRIANMSFIPAAHQFVTVPSASGTVLSGQIVEDYQRDLAKVTVDENIDPAHDRRREILRLYRVHKNAPDDYVYPICAGLENDCSERRYSRPFAISVLANTRQQLDEQSFRNGRIHTHPC